VWRARDGAGQVVAVKRIPVLGDHELAQALAEDGVRLLGLGQADAVVGWRVVVDGPVMGLVMDLAADGSWTDRLRRGAEEQGGADEPGAAGEPGAANEKACPDARGGEGRPADEVASVGAQVAATLAILHRNGILHGDLKGSAVLFDGYRGARLGDVGVAARFADLGRSGPLAAGTLGHLDPAVVAGHPFGPPSDVFALGLLCAEMLLGELPVPPTPPLAPRQASRALERRLLGLAEGAPSLLAEAIRAAADPRPEFRPTAAELSDALAGSAGGRDPLGPTPQAGRTRARHARVRARPPVRDRGRPPLWDAAPREPVGRPAGVLGAPRQPVGRPAGVLGPRAQLVGGTRRGWGLGRRRPRRSLQRRAAVVVSTLMAAALAAGALWRAAGPGVVQQRACTGSLGGHPASSGMGPARAGSLGPRCRARVGRVDGDLEVRSGGSTVVLRLRPAMPEAQVVLADFGCDGRDTPAVYDPRTGLVAVYQAWPRPGRPVRPASVWRAARGGRLVARTRPGTRCSTAAVAPAHKGA
jgi:hypothetical protein